MSADLHAALTALSDPERERLGTWLRRRGVYSRSLVSDIADVVDQILGARLAAHAPAPEVCPFCKSDPEALADAHQEGWLAGREEGRILAAHAPAPDDQGARSITMHTAGHNDSAPAAGEVRGEGLSEEVETWHDADLTLPEPEDVEHLTLASPATLARVRAEAGAEALEAWADLLDRESAESDVRARTADVRCLDCNLRYEERQEYGCGESGRGHDFDQGDLDDAAAIKVEETYDAKRLRDRARVLRDGGGE